MCLLIAKPDGSPRLLKYHLKNGFRQNPHGAGFVVAKNGRLLMRKGFKDFKDFWKSYREFSDCPAIVHFRWASVGEISVRNCHPFWVDKELAFAHNGTINIDTNGDKTMSDTRMFNDTVIKPCREHTHSFLEKNEIMWLISESIGLSKLAFLDKSGDIFIVNESLGEKHNGSWFSNSDYTRTTAPITVTSTTTNVNGWTSPMGTKKNTGQPPYHPVGWEGAWE